MPQVVFARQPSRRSRVASATCRGPRCLVIRAAELPADRVVVGPPRLNGRWSFRDECTRGELEEARVGQREEETGITPLYVPIRPEDPELPTSERSASDRSEEARQVRAYLRGQPKRRTPNILRAIVNANATSKVRQQERSNRLVVEVPPRSL